MIEAPALDELNDFTLNSYTKLLRYLKSVYSIVRFCDAPQTGSYLILRHDIDYSLQAALRMAYIERDLGVKATYFVLFSNDFYDVLETNSARVIREISGLGHEIGLHYCPLQYQSYHRNMNETLQTEIQMLEKISGKKVYSIARHGPWDRDPFASIRGYVNANHPYWRSDLFVHDSCRAWTRFEGLIKLLDAGPKRAQLLTHPENWQEDKVDRATLLDRLFQCSQKNYSEIEYLRRIWLTDPLVVEYESVVKNEKAMARYVREGQQGSKPKTNLAGRFEYYTSLFRWYLINSSLGWNYHRILSNIRENLGI